MNHTVNHFYNDQEFRNIKKISGLMRSHYCGELRLANKGETVELCGWINKSRDLGALFFIDLRDKTGLTQLSFDEFKSGFAPLKELTLESVIKIKGVVRARPQEAQNDQMATGAIEVVVHELTLLSRAEEPPFLPQASHTQASEDLRLKFRYLDLRTDRLQKMIKLRSEVMAQFRMGLYELAFTEVETPILYKTTPEGARDYLVPSRVHPGKFYALPQSPQTLKQLLMIGNLDKYFQICKCFRDEDLRADRQPEFSQVDIEVSFATQEYMKNLVTSLVKRVFHLSDDFSIPTMSYQEAMNLYGSDKPDVRYDLKHYNVTSWSKKLEMPLLQNLSPSGLVKAIVLTKSQGDLARKDIDQLGLEVKKYGETIGLWFKYNEDEFSGGIAKFLTKELFGELKKQLSLTGEGLVYILANNKDAHAHAAADYVRRFWANQFKLIPEGVLKFLWINEFPLLEYDSELNRFFACHHPFTSPSPRFHEQFMQGTLEESRDVLKGLTADAYDIVCNGYEMGGGSVRIFNSRIQERMFEVLGMTEEEVREKFGFFIDALKYGTPPHAGIAFGLDRTVMLKAGTENIRDVIAFPKTNSATDLMSQTPSFASAEQLKELHLKI